MEYPTSVHCNYRNSIRSKESEVCDLQHPFTATIVIVIKVRGLKYVISNIGVLEIW